MDLPKIRRDRLRAFCDQHCGGNEAELARRADRKQPQIHDMLAGKKAFGEKVARSLEINLGLPYRSLDQPDDNDTDTAGVVAGYQSGGDDKRTAMKDIADLPEEVSSALRPIIDALKAKYGKT